MRTAAAKEQRAQAVYHLKQYRLHSKYGLSRKMKHHKHWYKFHQNMATALGWTRFNVPMKG